MLKRMVFGAAGVVAGLIANASPAMASGLDPKSVPEDVRWLVHIDVDAIANSGFWELIEDHLDAKPEQAAQLQQIEMFTGMSIPQDLHAVTLLGMGFEESENVILIKGTANQGQLLGFLQMNPQFASKAHGTHDVITWEDKGKINHGSFYNSELIIMGQNEQNVMRAIDALDGKSPTASAGSALTQPAGTGVLVGLAAEGVAELANRQKDNPFMKNVKTAWFTFAQTDEKSVQLSGKLTCTDEKVAQQMKQMADGLKAVGVMLASDEKADPKLKQIAPFLPGAEITGSGADVMLKWNAPLDQVKELVRQAMLKQ